MKALMTIWLSAMLLLFSSLAQANLTIEITRGSDRATPIAIVPFSADGESLPEDVAQIISDNLERSGYFAPLPRNAMYDRPTTGEEVRYGQWRALDVRYLVVGQVSRAADGYRIRYELMDVSGQRRMLGESVSAGSNELRSGAHYVSDQIFEAITGIRGAFSTRIAYVTAQGTDQDMQFGLYVADADGHNSQQVLSSREPILSPAWSPDGRKLAYVSFETERPAIYVQEVGTGQRAQVASFDGINGAPAWSPDGRRLAMTLSKDGQPDIYIMDVGSRNLERITNNSSIDTEPAWSPDGRSLIFTSDRSGGPQIYRYSFGSGQTERLTFTGNYNARGRLSPDGEALFLVHRSNSGFQVARQDLGSGRLVVISETRSDESPSVAPNGTMVIFATQQGNSGVLGAVSADGRASYRLPSARGDVREPAWSPFLN
ncbi:Tol-Pal system protein TolB [Halomonas desiderata]|uniref:Tol-Pal system beta propeller repeat protein TolB n=1 Tax=Billgrantia desiderata TaxID=52021 RepID=UPI000A3C1234|nr:Tol-Pal system beta propeller repeat protein TolB [Halomonas desiderata]NIC36085.1 Tol-Pal system protein TolB [Halomonas desiderata]OUE38537.1 Tol-Pal system beta propeller repeat protein TolB [Halomonas desiderata SP1]